MTLLLATGTSRAVLRPERGGLLAELTLAAPDGRAVPVLFLPPDFQTGGSGWPGGGAPVCFPFAGRVFHRGQVLRYALGDAVFDMPLHGFAYAMPWTVANAGAASATLALTSGAASMLLYPFDFRLTADYELQPDALAMTMTAECRGAPRADAPRMPVALGVHPYFPAPLVRTGRPSACRLETTARAKVRVTPAGGAGKPAPFPENDDERAGKLTGPLFANLILGSHGEPRAALIEGDAGLKLGLGWDPTFKYCVLWTKGPDSGFHCIEPWMGLPDAVHNGEGVVWLKPGEKLAARFEMRLELSRR